MHAIWPALLFLPVVLAPPLNQDVAGVLDFALRWRAGATLYGDLVDVNPPLVFLLFRIPLLLDFLPPILALQLGVLGLGGVAAWLAARARERAFEGAMERAVLDAVPFLILLGAGSDFGQRDHLMAVMAWPYLLGAAHRGMGRGVGRPVPGRIPAALLAALGFALKPHFLVVPFLVELLVLLAARRPGWRSGWRPGWRWADPVPWAMAGLWAGYLAMLWLVFPAYPAVILPLARGVYAGLAHVTPGEMLLVPRLLGGLAVLVAGVVLGWRRGGLARVLGVAGLGALVAAVAQGKGWSYHLLPLENFAYALAGLLAARAVDAGRLGLPRRAALIPGLWMALVAATGSAPWKQMAHAGSEGADLARVLGAEPAGARVLVLSGDLAPAYPAVLYAGLRPSSLAMTVWPAQGADCGAAAAFLAATAADFARAPPGIVLADRATALPPCAGAADVLAWLRRDPLFAAAWADYRLAGTLGRYQLYRREERQAR